MARATSLSWTSRGSGQFSGPRGDLQLTTLRRKSCIKNLRAFSRPRRRRLALLGHLLAPCCPLSKGPAPLPLHPRQHDLSTVSAAGGYVVLLKGDDGMLNARATAKPAAGTQFTLHDAALNVHSIVRRPCAMQAQRCPTGSNQRLKFRKLRTKIC